MIIRKQQMEQMGDAMQREFERRMITHLRATFPQPPSEPAGDPVTAMVRRGIRRSASYGITAEADVQRYLDFMVIYGPEFDNECAWAREILNTEGISGTKKMDRVDDYDQFVLNRS